MYEHVGPQDTRPQDDDRSQVNDQRLELADDLKKAQDHIFKMESELWDLIMKNNDFATYTQRFQDMTMMCTNMVLEEEDRVEKFIRCLPHNIQGNVSLGCSGNTIRIMRRTLMIILVFTLCEEQVKWNSVLMRLIDDLLPPDSIVCFGFSDRRLEQTATFLISTNSKDPESLIRRRNLVQNTCQFHGLPDDDAIRHIDKFLEVIQHMKQNGVSDDALRLSLFPYSLTHHATAWNEITKFRQDPNKSLFEAWERYKLSIDQCPNHNMLLVTQIDTFYNGLTLRHRDTIKAAARGTFIQKTPGECYELIKNMTTHHNHWDTSATREKTSKTISSTTTTESPEVVRQLEMINKNFLDMMRQIQSGKSVNTNFADALLRMPKFSSTFKSLLSNKEKLFELSSTSLNENCSAVLLKKLPQKLRDPGKFLIPCDFSELEKCLALADLGASINLMPLSVWKKLSLLELTPTRMTLELANQSVAYPVGVAEDVFVKVGKFYFSADFVVVYYDVDPRVRFHFGRDRNFLRTSDELSNMDDDYYDTKGDILYLDKLLNEDPSLNLPPIKNGDLKQVDVTMMKPLIEEPSELELKDLPSHLEYVFLEGTDKLTVIISKELKDEENAALLKVLKSHKWAITWKISDIKGIGPRFCTHKILMEDDFKSAVQHQRRVILKTHEVIKKEVIKLLDAGLIYPIFDSPWVSPVHCVPKKGGMTVIENKDNELIPTRLVTGWRVCIDYRKLNDATRKDHFPLPFMDQILDRLARNVYYCFLDGFFGYFQISIDPQDQEKTTFTCPYGTFAY
nr:DNA-directed DNA polymerase [Tanacetum cinerariifolium]